MTHRKVRDVMTTDVRSVYVGSPVKVVAEQLAAGRISGLPVLDDQAKLVGVVSEADLLHKITYQDDADDWPKLFRRHRVDRTKAEGVLARDVMTAPAVTISPAASVVEAATVMERRGLKRLPVVDEDDSLVGILSRADLVRLFVRPDQEIRDEVQAQVLDRVLLLPAGSATVQVTEGVVTLYGKLQRKSEAEIAVELTRRTDGVVDVIDKLTFVEDDTTYRALHQQVDQPQGPYF